MTTFSSPLEVGARFTSGFAPARKLFGKIAPHAGDDWAPPKPGQSVPIYAVADGTVEAAGVGVLAGHSGQVVVIDHGMVGGDRTKTNYGHLASFSVRKGQKVSAGQKIGMMGATGNVTGVHLHLGVRFNGKFYSSKKWLESKGITVGKTLPITLVSHAGSAKPSKPASKPKPQTPVSTSKHVIDVKLIQQRLKNIGYSIVVDGKDGSKTRETIQRYQSSQKSPYTLVSDGYWGNKTEVHFNWTLDLQKAINKWKSKYNKLSVDGHYGANTVARIKDIQSRNRGGTYKGAVDGIPGRVFCKMVGVRTHP